VLDGLSLLAWKTLAMARSYHLNGTTPCHANSTMKCYGTAGFVLHSYLRDETKCVGLIAGDESVIDGIKDEFQAVGNT